MAFRKEFLCRVSWCCFCEWEVGEWVSGLFLLLVSFLFLDAREGGQEMCLGGLDSPSICDWGRMQQCAVQGDEGAASSFFYSLDHGLVVWVPQLGICGYVWETHFSSLLAFGDIWDVGLYWFRFGGLVCFVSLLCVVST